MALGRTGVETLFVEGLAAAFAAGFAADLAAGFAPGLEEVLTFALGDPLAFAEGEDFALGVATPLVEVRELVVFGVDGALAAANQRHHKCCDTGEDKDRNKTLRATRTTERECTGLRRG